MVTSLLLSQLNYGYWIELITGGVAFLVVYLVAAPLIRAVDKKDVRTLKEMLSVLGPFSPIFNIPLKIIEKLRGLRVLACMFLGPFFIDLPAFLLGNP